MSLISLHVLLISVWMSGVILSTSRTLFSVSEDVNTWTSSPELLWKSLHKFFTGSFEKNYHLKLWICFMFTWSYVALANASIVWIIICLGRYIGTAVTLHWLTLCFHYRGCQLRSDCGSWSGQSGRLGPRQRSERWSRKSVLPLGHPLEKRTTHTAVEMWLSCFICTCWATRHTLARWENSISEITGVCKRAARSAHLNTQIFAVFHGQNFIFSWSAWSWLHHRNLQTNG